MVGSLLLTLVMLQPGPTTATAVEAGPAADAASGLEHAFGASYLLDEPLRVAARSEVMFQRGRFADGEPVAVTPTRYEVVIEGIMQPMVLGPSGLPAQFRFEVHRAERAYPQGAERMMVDVDELWAAWDGDAPVLRAANGMGVTGGDRVDFARVIGPRPPSAPSLGAIIAWPDDADMGEVWGVDLRGWHAALEAEGYVVALPNVGGEASWVSVERNGDGEEDLVAVVRVLLWADAIRHRSQPGAFSGRLEERHDLFIPLDGRRSWRHVIEREQRFSGPDQVTDETAQPDGDVRQIVNRLYAKRRTELRWSAVDEP